MVVVALCPVLTVYVCQLSNNNFPWDKVVGGKFMARMVGVQPTVVTACANVWG